MEEKSSIAFIQYFLKITQQMKGNAVYLLPGRSRLS